MDKIWYRNPSKSGVFGRCGGDEKTQWPHRTDKSQTIKKTVAECDSNVTLLKYTDTKWKL